MRTKESMLAYLTSGSGHSYDDDDNGSGLFNTIDGFIRVKQLSKSNQKKVTGLVATLKEELEHTENPAKDYLENQYMLINNMVGGMYLLEKYKELKTKYNKLVKLADGLKVVLDGSYK
jgi:hypothetical protein